MENDPKEARRQEILMAALSAFAEKGYDKTTIEDIVRLSGLSKGTLYWYFANKQAIFAGLVQMVFDGLWVTFEVTLQQTVNDPPPRRLRRLLNGIEPAIDESQEWIGLYADFFNQAWQQPPLREIFRREYNRYIEAIEAILQQGMDDGYFIEVDPSLTARMLVGALDGLWFQQILEIGVAAPVLAQYAELIVRGLMKADARDA
jgi:AcrR family transcriptional regulator